MWIFLSGGFTSIVSSKNDTNKLLCRARRKGDLERIFGDTIDVKVTPHNDYRYRSTLGRKFVSEVIACKLLELTATNFKDSISDSDYHNAALDVWMTMSDYQFDHQDE